MPASRTRASVSQPVGEGARGDDLAVVALGRIDVVVVVVEAGALELADVVVGEHAERHARFHAHRLDAFDHGAQHVHVAALGRAPGGAHAVAGGAGVLRLLGLGEHALRRAISLLAVRPEEWCADWLQ